jgi:ribosomal protein L27
VGRRKLGHDPFRHGRFTIIVEQRENSLYKTQNKGCFIKYTLFSANQYKIQWYSYLVALVIEVTRIKKAYKINDLGLDIIGRIQNE